MNREECLTALTDTLRQYIEAIQCEAQVSWQEAQETAEHCTQKLIHSLEEDDGTPNSHIE